MAAEVAIHRPIFREEDIDQRMPRREDRKKRLRDVVDLSKFTQCNNYWDCLRRRLPILEWIPKYNYKKNLISDLLAGITIGVMMIPQSMAYGPLAGLDAAHGLYTSLFTSLFYFPFGSSHHNSYGVVAVTSMMAASIRYRLAPHDIDYYRHGPSVNETLANGTTILHAGPDEITPFEVISAVTFSCGIISLLMAFFRAGFLSLLISDQVSSAFTTAVAVHVLSSQIDKVLKIKVGRYSGVGKLLFVYYDLFANIGSTHLPSLGLSVVSFVALVFMKEWLSQRVMRGFLKGVPLPADMILIIIGTTISHFMQLQGYGYKIVGYIPSGIPEPKVPSMSIVGQVFLDSISVAIAIYCISISLAHMFGRRFGYKVDSEQELFAVGMTHVMTSFFGCMPPCAAMARTSVLIGSGGNSQLCGLVASFVVVLVIYFLGPLLQSLPDCILAVIIIVALKSMFKQFYELMSLWKVSKPDFLIWFGTFMAAVLLDITNGLIVGVILAFVTFGFRLIGKKLSIGGVFGDTELYFDKDVYPAVGVHNNIAIVAWKAPLFYGNANFFTEQIQHHLTQKWEDTSATKSKVPLTDVELEDNRTVALVSDKGRTLICDFSCVSLIDAPGLSALRRVVEFADKYKAEVFVTHCLESVKMTITRACGKHERLKALEFFPSNHDAFLFAKLCPTTNKM